MISHLITIALLITIAVVVYFRFIQKSKGLRASFESVQSIVLTNMSGDQRNLAELLRAKKTTFMMLMEIDNCPPCVYKGIQDLSELKKAGNCCLVVVVHNWPDEIRGWSRNYEFSPFYVLSKSSFYKHFNIMHLPAILKLRNNKIKSTRYITN